MQETQTDVVDRNGGRHNSTKSLAYVHHSFFHATNIAAEQLVNVLSSAVRKDSVLCINTYHVSCKDPSPRALLQS